MEFRNAMEMAARGFEAGARKYARKNWKEGGRPLTETLDSLLRHISAVLDGEDIDQETGVPHLALVLCNAIMANEWVVRFPETDDR